MKIATANSGRRRIADNFFSVSLMSGNSRELTMLGCENNERWIAVLENPHVKHVCTNFMQSINKQRLHVTRRDICPVLRNNLKGAIAPLDIVIGGRQSCPVTQASGHNLRLLSLVRMNTASSEE